MFDSVQIYYCLGAAMVGVVLENWKKVAVGDSLGNVYILQINPVGM